MVCYPENCRVSDKGIEQLFKILQLTELRLGSSMEEADGSNNIFTVDGFEAVLKTMSELTVLDMELPDAEIFKIGGMSIDLLFNLEMSDKSAQFVAHNLNNLTKLYIGKQCSDSGNNNVGD
jgi:hypothetical protein